MGKTVLTTWAKRLLWVPVPLLAGLSAWGMVLNQQQQPTPAPTASPTIAASTAPVTSATPLTLPPLKTPASPPLAQPSPPASQKPVTSPKNTAPQKSATPPSPAPVKPDSYSGQQAAINSRAKAHLAATSVDSLIEMKVAIGQGGSVTIGSTEGAEVIDQNGQSVKSLAPGESFSVSAGSGAALWVEANGVGMLTIGDRAYRGRFLLVSDGSKVLAVNYVNLRKYLYSVVGSEVSPSWNMNALKAQAVAARSYALTYYFKPVSKLYHMGSDEYYQVYSGIAKEADSTSRAVDETAGEFVSYRGGIVESLYAASDDIVMEAFAGHGMSQIGALHLGDKGYNYQQILANYYPGTGVGRIESDHE